MTQEKKHSETGQDCPEGYKSCDGYKIPKEWHIVRFDSLFSRVTRKNDENNQNVLTISAQQGLISQIEYYNTLYASENKTGYTLLHRGDFSYNKSYSSGYAYGAIKRLDAYEKGIVSPLYLCFTPRQGVNSDFYLQYFEAGCFDREIYKIAQEGARNHGLLNVSTEDFFHSMLVFPPLEEQECITEILTQCDHVIELKEQKLDELKQLKKEFLRKMFPAKGCDTPEIRFPGFTGAWEQRKLGDVCEIKDSARIPNSEWTESGVPYIRASDVTNENIDGVLFISQERYEFYKNRTGAPTKDDVLFNGGGEIGKCLLIADENPIYVQGGAVLYACTSESSKLVGQYLKIYFETTHAKSYIDTASAGGTMKHFTLKPSQMMPILIPSVDEQEKLGTYFFNLDHLITLHQRELEETKTYKKTLAKLLLTGIVRVQG